MWTFGFVLCSQLVIINSVHLAVFVNLWVCRFHLFLWRYRIDKKLLNNFPALLFLLYSTGLFFLMWDSYQYNDFQTAPLFLSIVLSFVMYIVFAFIYNIIVSPSFDVKDPPLMVALYAVCNIHFWLIIVLSSAIAIFPR